MHSFTNAPLQTRQDFQLVSLKLLAEQLLLSCPSYAGATSLPLYVPGDITRHRLQFSSPVVLYASQNNPGAAAAAAVLVEGVDALAVTESPPAALVSNGGAGTHRFLYLSHQTYIGEKGDALAEEVRQARAANLPLACDAARERHGQRWLRVFALLPDDAPRPDLWWLVHGSCGRLLSWPLPPCAGPQCPRQHRVNHATHDNEAHVSNHHEEDVPEQEGAGCDFCGRKYKTQSLGVLWWCPSGWWIAYDLVKTTYNPVFLVYSMFTESFLFWWW